MLLYQAYTDDDDGDDDELVRLMLTCCVSRKQSQASVFSSLADGGMMLTVDSCIAALAQSSSLMVPKNVAAGAVARVTTSLEKLEMSGNLTAVTEMSGN